MTGAPIATAEGVMIVAIIAFMSGAISLAILRMLIAASRRRRRRNEYDPYSEAGW